MNEMSQQGASNEKALREPVLAAMRALGSRRGGAVY
jgi:hypothetical protein